MQQLNCLKTMEVGDIIFQDYALSLAFSLSYICLFIILTLYKYEVMFRYGVLLVALSGPLYTLLYGLPYIFIAWRVLIGLNVSTDQKLYIGRRKGHSDDKSIEQNDFDKADFSGSTTLNHWIVAIQVAIQDGHTFIYTHAVDGKGAVVSGKGEKRPFKEIPEDKLNERYCLNHVGYVTRKRREEKLREMVENVPMVSGNSCQEYAVDIAFQLSSSRTYTFVKIMALPRVRNTVFYITVTLSTALTVLGYPYARLLNPLILTNLFAAWELSRIGIHNQKQGGYLPVIRAYMYYPTRGNFFLLLVICASLVYLYQRLGIEECIVIASVMFVIVLALLK